MNSGVTKTTTQHIPFSVGVYFKGVTFDEKVAPTLEEMKAGMFGATQEGGTATITAEWWAPEVDGVTVEMEELQHKVGEAAQMEVSFMELTPELIKNTVIGKLTETTDKNYDVITSDQVRKGHFYEGFGFYGKFLNGRPFIILFKKALCKSGFQSNPKNKENNLFKGTFTCVSDSEFGTTKLPYAIFLYKNDAWVAANPEEAAAASA